MSVIAPVLTGITQALGDISTISPGILLIFVAIFVGRMTASPVKHRGSRGARGARTYGYLSNDGKQISKEQFNAQQQQFYKNRSPSDERAYQKNDRPKYDNNGISKNQRDFYKSFAKDKPSQSKNKSTYQKKPYQKKPKVFTAPVRNVSARSTVLKSVKINPNAGAHSNRLYAHEQAQRKANADFRRWQQTASPAERNQKAIRPMTKEEIRRAGL